MNTEIFRKYVDIINENSVNGITDDETRYKVAKAMGDARYYMGQIYNLFAYPENYTKKPNELKNKLNAVTTALEPLKTYERTPGLYKNSPTTELRLINSPEINAFVHNVKYIHDLIDSKQVEEVKKLFIHAEEELLNYVKEIYKAMGDNSYMKIGSYIRK